VKLTVTGCETVGSSVALEGLGEQPVAAGLEHTVTRLYVVLTDPLFVSVNAYDVAVFGGGVMLAP